MGADHARGCLCAWREDKLLAVHAGHAYKRKQPAWAVGSACSIGNGLMLHVIGPACAQIGLQKRSTLGLILSPKGHGPRTQKATI